jgi:nitrite reductase/ring-hydroxylating ferredoxin subunit
VSASSSGGEGAQGDAAKPIRVGSLADFAAGERRFVTIGGREIGVLQWQGELFAYENRCIHQGGPVCEGVIIGQVETVFDERGRVSGQRFDDERPHLVCPWHGVEYDLRTGTCVVDRRRRIRSYPVQVRGEDVYVST